MPLDPELNPHFDEAARLNNLDPLLLRALASGESSFDPNATSPKGAGGLMQIMPETAKGYGIADPYDPVQAIYGGAKILNEHLTKAEGAKAAGANIVPIDEALRSYFAGPGGGNRGPLTANYPDYIGRRYLALQNGNEPPAAPPASGIDALAQAKATPMPATGGVATNAIPRPGTPDTFEPAPDAVAAQAGYGVAGASPVAATGADALLGVSKGARAGTQVAQALPTDEELLRLTNELLSPPQAPGGNASGQAPPSGQVLNPAYITEQQNQAKIDAALGVPTPQFTTDITRSGPGLPLNPETQRQLEGAKKLGENQQTIGPGGVIQPAPGAISSAAAAKGATAEAEQQAIRKTQADKPYENRSSGSSYTLSPGSTAAQAWIAAQREGHPPPAGVHINADGSVEVGNVNVPPEVVHQRHQKLDLWEKEAESSRLGLYEAQNLKDKLTEIGTSGPATEWLGKLAAVAKQAGVPDDTIAKLNLPKAATVEEANKLSIDLLGSILNQRFPGRVTNNDIAVTKPAVASANNMLEAGHFMLDKIAIPTFQRSIDRFNYASGISSDDPQLTTLYKQMNEWENAHPFDAYGAVKGYKPGLPGVEPPTRANVQRDLQGTPAPGAPASSAPPIPGATLGPDGKWRAIINGQPHILVPPPGGP